MSEIYERLCASLYSLVGDGTLQGRLADAYKENLRYLQPDLLPAKHRPLLAELHAKMNGDLSDDQAHDLIDRVLDCALDVLSSEPMRVVGSVAVVENPV